MEGAPLFDWPEQPPLDDYFADDEQMPEQEPPAEPAGDDAHVQAGAWGIGVTQETRPEGVSYKVRACLKGKARYLGRCVSNDRLPMASGRAALQAAQPASRPTQTLQ